MWHLLMVLIRPSVFRFVVFFFPCFIFDNILIFIRAFDISDLLEWKNNLFYLFFVTVFVDLVFEGRF
jgi:hypothetical protein